MHPLNPQVLHGDAVKGMRRAEAIAQAIDEAREVKQACVEVVDSHLRGWLAGEPAGGHRDAGHNNTGHNYMGHDCIGHNYKEHNYIGHNYIGEPAGERSYEAWVRALHPENATQGTTDCRFYLFDSDDRGHNYIGHSYRGHNYIRP